MPGLRAQDDSSTPIMIEGDDTEGHSWRGYVSEEDERLLEDALRERGPGPITVKLEPADEDDVEGHGFVGARSTATIRVVLDDDDTEGHVINVHFPTAEAADAFRRRLLATGLIAATLTIGAVGAANLPNLDIGSSAGDVANQAVAQQAWEEASMNEGARQGAVSDTGTVWPADARMQAEAAAQQAGANEAWEQASINEGARQSGTTDTGPMDINEARAAAAQAMEAQDSWQQASINEGLRQSGVDQPAGPMDINEAALRSSAGTDADRDTGLMDPVSRSAADRQAAIDAEGDRLQSQADAFASGQQRALDAESDRLQGLADAEAAQRQRAIDAESDRLTAMAEAAQDTRGGWEGSLAPSQSSTTDADRDLGLMDASGNAAQGTSTDAETRGGWEGSLGSQSSTDADEDTAPPGRGGVAPR